MKSCLLVGLVSLFMLTGVVLCCNRSQDRHAAPPPTIIRSEWVLSTTDDAKTVIDKALKAHGGRPAIARWRCGRLKYEAGGGIVPADLGKAIVEDTFQLPGHFKRIVRMQGGGGPATLAFVINHGKGWTKKGDRPPEAIENDFTTRTEHPFASFCNLLPLAEAGSDVQLIRAGRESVNGVETLVVRVRSEQIGDIDFSFAVQTGLLVRSKKALPDADPDKGQFEETLLSNYKEVQGAPLPMRVTGKQAGQPFLDITMIDASFAETFDEGTFAKP